MQVDLYRMFEMPQLLFCNTWRGTLHYVFLSINPYKTWFSDVNYQIRTDFVFGFKSSPGFTTSR